jgi:S1-C subfamily serine protease
VFASLGVISAAAQAQGGADAEAEAKADAALSAKVESAVVKIFSTTRNPDFARPWTRQAPTELTGSGVIIDGHRILTNAHVVAYAGQLQVQANREGDKFTAHVVAAAPDMDLAVLSLEDDSFFQRHAPLERSTQLPHIKDAVLAYGFPVGGTSLSITKGIVSRIEFAPYNVGAAGLRIQIDAAVNPGNSGGPAVVGDRMIGLTFSTLGGAQNIGYIIPNEEISLFLDDIADGHYDGKPQLNEETQTLENPALRSFLKLSASVHGVVVHRPLFATNYPLKPWDVITAIEGVPVDDEGMILVDQDLRVGLGYQLQRLGHPQSVRVTVVREGAEQTLNVPVAPRRPTLLPSLDGKYPSYFIYGPLVFSRATLDFISSLHGTQFAHLDVASSPLVTQLFDGPSPEREELVVIPSPLFPHPLSKGYGNVANSVVYAINGTPVRSLAHLVALLRDLKETFVVVTLDSKRSGEDLVFNRRELVNATEDILSDNGVRSQGSADMLKVWQAPPP